MTIRGKKITDLDMRVIASYMDDDIREQLHSKLAPCSNEKFLKAYIKRDRSILPILRNEFGYED